MTKISKGEKHICLDCETRFFDFGKKPETCPKCGAVVENAKPKKKSKAKALVEEVIEATPVPQTAIAEENDNPDTDTGLELADDTGEDDDEDDDGLMEDASDLGNVDDDMSDVIIPAQNNDN